MNWFNASKILNHNSYVKFVRNFRGLLYFDALPSVFFFSYFKKPKKHTNTHTNKNPQNYEFESLTNAVI